jgi:transcriptional regulator GlxA family with amidase domain
MLDVCVVLLSDNHASTAVGPIEVFDGAGVLWNTLRGEAPEPRFRVTTASIDGAGVSAPDCLHLAPQASIRDVGRADLVCIPSGGVAFERHVARNAALLPWLRERAASGATIAAVCTGVAYLAEAGLLDGREGTTQWAFADAFRRRYPRVDWRPDKMITEDRRILCGGGVYAAIDLSLFLVEKFCGHEIALQTAKALLVDMPRASQSGYAVLPISRAHADGKIRIAESYIEKHFASAVSVEHLASLAGMSPRNFVRRFKAATGLVPGNYVQSLRIQLAKEMLEEGARSVQQVSAAVGYEDPAFFRALFKRHTGMRPAEYRERFRAMREPAARAASS